MSPMPPAVPSAQRERRTPGAHVDLPPPADLVAALREEDALEDWGTMPPGRRAMLVRYIEDAAQETTRSKRTWRAVPEVLARRERRIDHGEHRPKSTGG